MNIDISKTFGRTRSVIVESGDINGDERAFEKPVTRWNRGVDAIAKATLAIGRWQRAADVLRTSCRASTLGSGRVKSNDSTRRETKEATSSASAVFRALGMALGGSPASSRHRRPVRPHSRGILALFQRCSGSRIPGPSKTIPPENSRVCRHQAISTDESDDPLAIVFVCVLAVRKARMV